MRSEGSSKCYMGLPALHPRHLAPSGSPAHGAVEAHPARWHTPPQTKQDVLSKLALSGCNLPRKGAMGHWHESTGGLLSRRAVACMLGRSETTLLTLAHCSAKQGSPILAGNCDQTNPRACLPLQACIHHQSRCYRQLWVRHSSLHATRGSMCAAGESGASSAQRSSAVRLMMCGWGSKGGRNCLGRRQRKANSFLESTWGRDEGPYGLQGQKGPKASKMQVRLKKKRGRGRCGPFKWTGGGARLNA